LVEAAGAGQGWRWRLVAVVGAAAAVVVIGLVLSHVTRSHTPSKTASGPVSSHVIRAGDLGDVGEALALRSKLEPALQGHVSTASAAGVQPARCEPEARKLQPTGAVLVYEATASWQGTPAGVFGFSPPGAPATTAPGRPTPTRVYVLARADCRLLVFQSYAP
jgi:hypothetical protein